MIERLKCQRYRDSTHDTYYKIWKIFGQFYQKLDYKPDTWEEKIVLFAGFLIDNNLKSGSVRSYLSAIKGILAEDNIKIQEDEFLLSSLMRACKIKNDIVIMRLPIYKDLLNLILKQTDKHFNKLGQIYLRDLYKAMFASAYYGLLRAGEITDSPHTIMANDVYIGENKKKILFVLHSSKTHGPGDNPQFIKITKTPNIDYEDTDSEEFCPFRILKTYIDNRPGTRTETEKFFVHGDNTAVTAYQLRSTLKTLLKKLNMNADLYNLHSFRIGRCSNLHKLGVSVETVKHLGRWKSNTVFKYLRN